MTAGAHANIASSGSTAGRFASEQVSRQTLTWIFIAQGFAILPLFAELPAWLPVFWLCAVLYRIQVYRGVWPFPGRWLKTLFGVGGMAGLVMSFSRIAVEPMIGLLVLSFVLKLVEVRDRSSVLIILYIGFVAVGTQLLMAQTFLFSSYAVFCCWILMSALHAVFRHRQVTFGRQLRDTGVLMLQSLPVMLILFVVMPRMGQLWAVPSISGAGKTGFSDSMSPGDFSRLTGSSEIVLRASFEDGQIPPPADRYWRGLVLEHFDGRTWSRRGGSWLDVSAGTERADKLHSQWQLLSPGGAAVNPDTLTAAETYRYSVLLEPHQYGWLFALMMPVKADGSGFPVRASDTFGLVSRVPVFKRIRYDVISLKKYRINASNTAPGELQRNLILPHTGNVRARQLVASWKEEGLDNQALINRMLQYYMSSFAYTLQPPPLPDNTVDRFLFESRRGFCEHFASSFVFMMRAAGIPARVVVGYQGGEYKADGNYLVVRQSDAHAWSEVWLEGQGWLRVDPTAAVSPSRIESSLLDAIGDDEASMVGGAIMRLRTMALFANFKNRLEEWDYKWQMSVMGYDSGSQGRFFEKLLGGNVPWRIGVFFVGTLTFVLGLYYLAGAVRHGRKPTPAHEKAIHLLLHRLAARGFERQPNETLRQFVDRIRAASPALAAQVVPAVDCYYAIAYEGQVSRLASLEKFVRLV